MQLRQFVGFHSGINKLAFLLLHETTLAGKWLHTVRQEVRVSFSKGQTSKTILPLEIITIIFLRNRGKPNDDGI